jgi:hypothetical protein
VADRILTVIAIALAALTPLALGLAVALVQSVPLTSVLVLWGSWLLVLGAIVVVALRPVRGGRR